MRHRSERRTIDALRQGRRDAYLRVIDAHYRPVYRFLLFLGRDASLAEDLTQEVFASAWRALDGFRGDASIGTWLHRIAYNAFLDAQRRRERDKTLVGMCGGHNCAEESGTNPLACLLADEDLSQVTRALGDLDLEERTVLVLHYIDGLSYREMAQILRQPDGTVKWITSRALGRLRTRLSGKVES